MNQLEWCHIVWISYTLMGELQARSTCSDSGTNCTKLSCVDCWITCLKERWSRWSIQIIEIIAHMYNKMLFRSIFDVASRSHIAHYRSRQPRLPIATRSWRNSWGLTIDPSHNAPHMSYSRYDLLSCHIPVAETRAIRDAVRLSLLAGNTRRFIMISA